MCNHRPQCALLGFYVMNQHKLSHTYFYFFLYIYNINVTYISMKPYPSQDFVESALIPATAVGTCRNVATGSHFSFQNRFMSANDYVEQGSPSPVLKGCRPATFRCNSAPKCLNYLTSIQSALQQAGNEPFI